MGGSKCFREGFNAVEKYICICLRVGVCGFAKQLGSDILGGGISKFKG